jgi:hypothetical protein
MKMPSQSAGARSACRTVSRPFTVAARTCEVEAEWRAFQHVLAEALECVIDHAIVCVADEPEDVRALEHLRTLTRSHFAGIPMPIRMQDFLHAMAILLGGFQVEPRPTLPFCGTGDSQPLAVAAERLRHVAQAAATASRCASSRERHGEPTEPLAAEPTCSPPTRRSKPRRAPKVVPTAA